jgi:hypothetical protein
MMMRLALREHGTGDRLSACVRGEEREEHRANERLHSRVTVIHCRMYKAARQLGSSAK